MRLHRAAAISIVALVLASPIITVAMLRAIDDRPMLQDVRVQALPLFEETARLIDPAYEPRPHPGSELPGPFDISNDPFGYDHCDAWRDWILPGWSAGTWHDFDVADAPERASIIAKVQNLWDRQDGTQTIRDPADARPVQLHQDEITYTLVFPENQDVGSIPEGSVTVTIDCLSVD